MEEIFETNIIHKKKCCEGVWIPADAKADFESASFDCLTGYTGSDLAYPTPVLRLVKTEDGKMSPYIWKNGIFLKFGRKSLVHLRAKPKDRLGFEWAENEYVVNKVPKRKVSDKQKINEGLGTWKLAKTKDDNPENFNLLQN